MIRFASRAFYCSFLFICAQSGSVTAQDGTVHGASILPQLGGGCFFTANNAPVPNPFIEPATSNAIYCKETFSNVVTYQGEADTDSPFVGQNPLPPATQKNFLDTLENKYTESNLASEFSYCGGQSCYPGAPQDGAFRVTSAALTLKNTVKAINAKDEPNENLAFRLAWANIINGKSIGYELEGGKQVLILGKDEVRKFEIFPVAPGLSDETALTNENFNPYSIDWVEPDKSTTPHKEIVPGLNFESKFSGGKWRYHLEAKGNVLPSIGKYMINFRLTRKIPITVSFQYRDPSYNAQYCATPNACSRSFEPSTIGTFTIAYGTEQCLKQAGVGLPSYAPLMNIYGGALKLIDKNLRLVFNPLNSLAKRDSVRSATRRFRRNIFRSEAFVKEALTFETQNLKSLTEFYTASELGAVSEQLINKAIEAIADTKGSRKKKPSVSIRQIARQFGRQLNYAKNNVPNGGKIAKQLKKVETQIKKAITAADKAYNTYAVDMQLALESDRQLRENSFRCEAVF